MIITRRRINNQADVFITQNPTKVRQYEAQYSAGILQSNGYFGDEAETMLKTDTSNPRARGFANDSVTQIAEFTPSYNNFPEILPAAGSAKPPTYNNFDQPLVIDIEEASDYRGSFEKTSELLRNYEQVKSFGWLEEETDYETRQENAYFGIVEDAKTETRTATLTKTKTQTKPTTQLVRHLPVEKLSKRELVLPSITTRELTSDYAAATRINTKRAIVWSTYSLGIILAVLTIVLLALNIAAANTTIAALGSQHAAQLTELQDLRNANQDLIDPNYIQERAVNELGMIPSGQAPIPPPVTLPPIQDAPPARTPNTFDKIAQWFGSLFGK